MLSKLWDGRLLRTAMIVLLIFAAFQVSCSGIVYAADDEVLNKGGTKDPLKSIEESETNRRDFRSASAHIRLDVVPIKQDSENRCWATVYAMMLSWKIGRQVSPQSAVAALGAPYTGYFADDKGLPGGQERPFVSASGLHALPPASYPLTDFRRLLRTKGPVWIIAGDGISTSHARLLIGIYGNDEAEKRSTYENTTMEFIDPASGTYVYEPAVKFYEVFEREAAQIVDEKLNALDLRWQVISF